MKKEYDLKAYPVREGIREIFEVSYGEYDFIEYKDVHKYVREWCIEAHQKKLISSEHLNPSARKINDAMDKVGYSKARKTVNNDKITIYECIILKDSWKRIFTPEIIKQIKQY